ncbi:tyrosine-type recombinase/integrase [Kytococcus schroeteri]|uniref:tyrosine-type recombinase/integrase n=1 Tax=Kytococcus schroeteri TaxID=138300 RepID=UPI0035EAB280
MSKVETAARVLTARLPDGSKTHTVVDPQGLPVTPVEEYLNFLRQDRASPHTVQAYARGLAAWFTLLGDGQWDWTDFPTFLFGTFLTYLRTGDLPSVARIGPPGVWLSEASVAQRSAAVLAFYTWQASANGHQTALSRLYSSGRPRRAPYVRALAGVTDHSKASQGGRPIYRSRRPHRGRPPVLTPEQINTIVGDCVPRNSTPEARLSAARDKFLFALLPETALRLGEALSLRHCDFHVGAGDTPRVDVVPRQDHPHGCRSKSDRFRQIYISDELEAAYSAYVWELIDAGIDLAIPEVDQHWVFVNVAREPLWAPMAPGTVYDRVAAIKRRHPDLPQDWGPHWMRHTHATALLLAGVPPHVVMRRLGHADYQTTLEMYGWVTEDAELRNLSEWKTFTAGWKELNA